MDWKRIISGLTEAGLTQVRIGELCGVAQSTISDLARGASKSPTYELGVKLVQLHDEQCAAGPAKPDPAPSPAEPGDRRHRGEERAEDRDPPDPDMWPVKEERRTAPVGGEGG